MTNGSGLTKREFECMVFLQAAMKNNPVAPNYEEIKQGLGLGSKAGPHRLLWQLHSKGRIKVMSARARSIEILQPVDDTDIQAEPRTRAEIAAMLRDMADRIEADG
jgi:repressor LexA